MARPADPLLRPRLARYLARLRPPLDDLRGEMRRFAEEAGWSVTDPDVARLWEMLAASTPGGRVLELGTGIGYGTLHLARGAREGRVVSIDCDAAALAHAAAFLGRAGVAGRVELVPGRALELLPGLAGPFDLVVIDADPIEARRCLDLVVPLVSVGGRIAVDRLLLDGRVADPALRQEPDRRAEALERFNPYFTIYPQLASLLLPIGQGVGLATKRRETLRELGGPF